VSTPREPLATDTLRALAAERWARIDVVDEATSTNATLLADEQAPDRSVLVAEHQTAGRGRLDRSWESPARAGLTFSVLLRPSAPLLNWGWLPLLAGVALHEAVAATTGVSVALKWPNDLLAGVGEDRAGYGKVAGILTQTSGEVVVIGIGLNVSTTADELPFPGATSLALCGAGTVDRAELLGAILAALDHRYSQWSDVDGNAEACGLTVAYLAACATIGQQVRVGGTDAAVVVGRAVDIDASGRLRLDVDGVERSVGAGDVEHLRPA
jgi:BirA family transcriptional regulator, biotin operon repressor / biotin---[acetyl-CoA-carboxylase] ligase